MIRVISDAPDNVLAVEAVGTVTDDDYDRVLAPALAEKLDEHGALRFVYVLGDEFEGWTADAMWRDAKVGGRNLKAWERVAVVTDKDWLTHLVKAFGWMLPGEVRTFALGELQAAKEWAAG